MSTFSRPWSRLALVGLSTVLLACSEGGGPVVTSASQPTKPKETPGTVVDNATPAPTPSPTPAPTLQSLLIVPSDLTLSSDPTDSPSSRGANLALIATLSNGQQVSTTASWSVSPAGLVSINAGGYVSAIANAPPGTATVQASSGSILATAAVHVTAKPLTVQSISLSSTGLVLYVPAADGLDTAGLPISAPLVGVVTMSDGSTTSAVTWSSSNDQVATVSASGLVTTVGAGTATLTAQAAQDPNQTANCVLTVKAQGLVDVTVE